MTNIYLYIKTHNKTGLKYLGKTIRDPYIYKGSGIYWTNHINKHGYDVTTEVIKICQSREELTEQGLYYSRLWNIVESKAWANLKEESGDGGDTSMCPNFIKGIANRDQSGEKNPMFGGFSDNHRANISKSKKGKMPPNADQFLRAAKGKSYWHNVEDNVEKRFLQDQVPAGWVKGRLRIPCVCGKAVDISNFKKYHSKH